MSKVMTANELALSEAKRWKLTLTLTLGAMIVFGSFIYLEIDLMTLLMALPDFLVFFVQYFLPPNFANMNKYVPLIIDTLFFAVAGTYVSAIIGFVFGLLLSEQTNPYAPVRFIVRFILSFLRNVPILAWAALLIYIFGIGNLVGLIALVLATLGFLARSYAESISEIAGSKLEALKASGASNWQIIIHGLIPEFIPAWINWTLFSFEINIRASAILGMVGAGGIGIMIQTNMKLFKYEEAFALIIILAAMVLLTEWSTNKFRKMLH